MIKESKRALTAAASQPTSFARIQVVNGLTTKATPVAWYVCLHSVWQEMCCPPPPSILTIVPASQQKYEACLDIYEGRLVWLRGPFEAGMHDMTIFRGGKEEDRKENWDHNALYFKVCENICLCDL